MVPVLQRGVLEVAPVLRQGVPEAVLVHRQGVLLPLQHLVLVGEVDVFIAFSSIKLECNI